jgi:hypothetical protein
MREEVTHHDLPELRLRLPVFAVLLLRPLKLGPEIASRR